MNFIYYIVGAFITFLGILAYEFFRSSNGLLINGDKLIQVGIISLISGLAFFLADYLMNRISK